MQIDYNKQLKVAGLGVTPWARIGLEDWLTDYRIIASQDWDCADVVGAPVVIAPPDDHMRGSSALTLSRSTWFHNVVTTELAEYRLLPYKPLPTHGQTLGGLAPERFIMAHNRHTASFENKANIRERLGAQLPFAPYRIVERDELAAHPNYDMLRQDFEALVLQHESMSGGRGTHLVRSQADLVRAIAHLPTGKLVVSRLIEGALERSLQGCITKRGAYFGTMQKQLIGRPELTNMQLATPSLFCGAEIGAVPLTDAQNATVQQMCDVIGGALIETGYQGIFGIDCLVTATEVYMVEVNARLTGVTPLHTMFYGSASHIPFYALHTLELAGEDYRVHVDSAALAKAASGCGSMLILYDVNIPAGEQAKVTKQPQSGIYSFEAGQLSLVRHDYRFRPEDRNKGLILVQQYQQVGSTIKAGGWTATIFTDDVVTGADDALLPKTGLLITSVRRLIETSKY